MAGSWTRALGATLLLGACNGGAATPDASSAPVDAAVVDAVVVDAAALDAAASCPRPTFGTPEMVTITGYDGDAMEPFLLRTGDRLLFNDSNAAPDTQLHVATRVDDRTFRYDGELPGASSTVLDGVPSVAADTLYFVSLRSYDTTFSTIYRAHFDGSAATDVTLAAGVSRAQAPWVNFDAEISASGERLYVVDGLYDLATRFWAETHLLALARNADGSFTRAPSPELDAVQSATEIEYAPATSEDELVLYFTRIPTGGVPRLFVATRASTDLPFCAPTEVVEATGFVEAATVAPDGSIYYHERDPDGVYRLRRLAVTRQR